MSGISELFSTQQFMPHGHCYLWFPHILWTHVGSDLITGLAYMSIPGALFYFSRKRPDLGLNKVISLFVAFIVLCGLTHFMAIYTIWNPVYFQFGLLKALTAAVSLITAIALWPLLPKLIATPSVQQLSDANAALSQEVRKRKVSEQQLANRNLELERTNASLHEVKAELEKSQARLSQALEGSGAGLWSWDFKKNLGWQSSNWTERLGLDGQDFDLSVDGWLGLVHPEDRAQIAQAFESAKSNDGRFKVEYRIRQTDGDYRWVEAAGEVATDEDGQPMLMAGTLVDVNERREAELFAERQSDALRRSENSLRDAQKIAKLGSFAWSPKTDLVDLSSELCRILNVDENEETSIENLFDALPVEERALVAEQLKNTLADGQEQRAEYTLRNDVQVQHIVVITRAETMSRDERTIVGTVQDITILRTAMVELERSQGFLTEVLESVSDGIVACDANGELTLFNRAARNFHGLGAAGLDPSDWAKYYSLYDADGETLLDEKNIPLARAFRGEDVEGQEIVIAPVDLPHRRLECRASPLHGPDGEKIGAVATMHDVTTERVQSEALYRQAQELELIFNNVPVRMWLKDDKNKIIRLNEPAARSMGVTVEEATGADTYDLFPDMAKKYHEDDLAVIESGKELTGIIEEYTPKNAPISWVNTDKVPYTNPQTGERFIFVVSTDITALVDARDELNRSNAELEQFARVASHDLQEPLRKLVIFSGFLEQDLGEDIPEKAKEDLDAISNAAARMQTLVKDILSLARMRGDGLKLAPVSPKDAIANAMQSLAGRCAESNAVLVYDEMYDVLAEPVLLTQVYQNLVGNALKFIGEDQIPRIHFSAEIKGRNIVLGVKDNGIGIAKAQFSKIFDPLTRLHSRDQYEGTGIGLAICRKAIESLGGRLWVESTPGEGAHFKFSLERAVAEESRKTVDMAG